jgi:hypothetical protein
MASPGETMLESRVISAEEPITFPSLVQTYEITGLSPSSSVAVVEQLRIEVVVTPELGSM